MKTDTFANRLQKAMNLNNIKPVDLSKSTGIDKSSISSYLSGRYRASDENKQILAKALEVSDAWLEGYDVPINNEFANETYDEMEILYKKYKNILTEDDIETMKFLIEKRKREIDKQNNNE